MSVKQMIMLLSGLFGFFIIALLVVWGIVKIDPTLIGLPPLNKPAGYHGKDYYEPKIGISRADMDNFQKEILKSAVYKNERDFYQVLNKKFQDSINNFNSAIKQKQDLYNKAQDSISTTISKNSNILDSLKNYQNLYKTTLNKLKDVESLVANHDLLKRRTDSLENINYQEFAKIYNNSSPTEIAKILDKIDEQDAAKILKMMNKKKAGKVIEAMNPERGAAILLIGKDSRD